MKYGCSIFPYKSITNADKVRYFYQGFFIKNKDQFEIFKKINE